MERISDLSSQHQISFDLIPHRFSKKVILSTLLLILSGALNTILFKSQTSTFGLKQAFISIQIFLILIGQYLNLLFFHLKIMCLRPNRLIHFQKYKNRAMLSGRKFRFNSLKIGLAALINCLASGMQLFALARLPASLFQMLAGFGVVFAPFLSLVALKRRIYPHTLFGIFASVAGLAAILASAFYLDAERHKREELWSLAVAIMLGGVFLGSLGRVYEEWLLGKIETSAYRFIGLEGLYGVIFLFLAHCGFLAASFSNLLETDFFGIGKEMVAVAGSRLLWASSLVLIFSSTVSDITGIIVTKKVSATYRVVNETARVVLVWLAQIFLFDLYDEDIGSWDYLLLTVSKIAGYGLLVFGNVLINEIREISLFGLDRYFGRYQNAKFEENLMEESEEFSIMKS